jgi:hypothetical protein
VSELRRWHQDRDTNPLANAADEIHKAATASNWHDSVEKARYLLDLLVATLAAQEPRRQTLIAGVLPDPERLSATKAIAAV